MGEVVNTTYKGYSYWKKEEKAEDYVYEGTKNKTTLKSFVKLCKKTQKEMKSYLERRLRNEGYKEIYNEDGFLYAPGDIPVLLTAHMDTVHKERIEDFYEAELENGNHKLHSPQGIGGDDRCGIYIILQIIAKGYRPYILFCEDEEIGCVGSEKFVRTDHIFDLSAMKYLILLDRRGRDDCVFYDCDNRDFVNYVRSTTGNVEAYGTCSDISILAPECGVSAVNLSCGYYNEHHLNEYVILEEMKRTYEITLDLLDDLDNVSQFEYVERSYRKYSVRTTGGYEWYDDYDYYSGYYNNSKTTTVENEKTLYGVNWMDEGILKYMTVEASSRLEAVGMFLMDHEELTYNDIIVYPET